MCSDWLGAKELEAPRASNDFKILEIDITAVNIDCPACFVAMRTHAYVLVHNMQVSFVSDNQIKREKKQTSHASYCSFSIGLELYLLIYSFEKFFIFALIGL